MSCFFREWDFPKISLKKTRQEERLRVNKKNLRKKNASHSGGVPSRGAWLVPVQLEKPSVDPETEARHKQDEKSPDALFITDDADDFADGAKQVG